LKWSRTNFQQRLKLRLQKCMLHIFGSRPKARDTLKILKKDKMDLEFHLPLILEDFFEVQSIGKVHIYVIFIIIH
jgi:hypothetical protein